MLQKLVVHEQPIWRDRGNITIALKLTAAENGVLVPVEHFWCKQIGDNYVELCCIPFFAYNLALGDQFELIPDQELYGFAGMVKHSGRSTFRVWFGDTPNSAIKAKIASEISNLGCLMEWYPPDLLAVDAESDDQQQAVLRLLEQKRYLNHVQFEIAKSNRSDEFASHAAPVHRGKANFLIHAEIAGGAGLQRWEQLWTRRMEGNRHEICCIPFFIYDLALGDEVEIDANSMLQRVVKLSGTYAFRVWFGSNHCPEVRTSVLSEIATLECEYEWYSMNLLAIDVSEHVRPHLEAFLNAQALQGCLIYETGRA